MSGFNGGLDRLLVINRMECSARRTSPREIFNDGEGGIGFPFDFVARAVLLPRRGELLLPVLLGVLLVRRARRVLRLLVRQQLVLPRSLRLLRRRGGRVRPRPSPTKALAVTDRTPPRS